MLCTDDWQVLGHSKSVLVLLGGGLLFHEALASKEWLGELRW
jgi:hypothetical protein